MNTIKLSKLAQNFVHNNLEFEYKNKFYIPLHSRLLNMNIDIEKVNNYSEEYTLFSFFEDKKYRFSKNETIYTIEKSKIEVFINENKIYKIFKLFLQSLEQKLVYFEHLSDYTIIYRNLLSTREYTNYFFSIGVLLNTWFYEAPYYEFEFRIFSIDTDFTNKNKLFCLEIVKEEIQPDYYTDLAKNIIVYNTDKNDFKNYIQENVHNHTSNTKFLKNDFHKVFVNSSVYDVVASYTYRILPVKLF